MAEKKPVLHMDSKSMGTVTADACYMPPVESEIAGKPVYMRMTVHDKGLFVNKIALSEANKRITRLAARVRALETELAELSIALQARPLLEDVMYQRLRDDMSASDVHSLLQSIAQRVCAGAGMKSIYGCYNSKPPSATVWVQDGYIDEHQFRGDLTRTRTARMVKIPDPMTKHCVYTLSKKTNGDKHCAGCSRKSDNPTVE